MKFDSRFWNSRYRRRPSRFPRGGHRSGWRFCILLLLCGWLMIGVAPTTSAQPPSTQQTDVTPTQQSLDPRLHHAQQLNTQANQSLRQGQPAQAYELYQRAEVLYRQAGDRTGPMLTQLNQVQALQALGYYSRARRLLLEIATALEQRPNPSLKLRQLRSLGTLLQNVGELEAAATSLDQALQLATQQHAPDQIAAIQFQLGNLAQIQQNWSQAQAHYQAVSRWIQQYSLPEPSPESRQVPLQALPSPQQADWQQLQINNQLQQLRVAVKTLTGPKDIEPAIALAADLQPQLDRLPLSRWAIDSQIHWSESLRLLQSNGLTPAPIASDLSITLVQQLRQTQRQAQQLQDQRAESLILGQMGAIYEQNQQFQAAQALTQEALSLSLRSDLGDLAAQWHWQMGRLLRQQGQRRGAIAQYEASVRLLQELRQELVAVTPDFQFAFRDQVEPVYRQLVRLLLADVDSLPPAEKQERLERSRQTIEALQLAQVQNFLRQACQTYDTEAIEQIDPEAAVFYSIVLEDQLEVILSLPNQPLQHYSSSLSKAEQNQLIQDLRQSLNPAFPAQQGLPAAQDLYNRLIRPAEPWLQQQPIKTLVFVLDDFLPSLPLAVLHDGDRYLVENYAIALTPSLQLLNSQPIQQRDINLLAGGLTQARQGFAPLPAVAEELSHVVPPAPVQPIKAKILLDQTFTLSQLTQKVAEQVFCIVHLATHGQFSSKATDTFLLTWDDRIRVEDLKSWLNPATASPLHPPIELLVLSACQTARGDDRAALGLAGMAVQSGARSTLATLWSVQDQSTAELMTAFYQQLFQVGQGRAESLRQAQIKLLQGNYSHPYYWAPFVLVGNWQ